jgi:hypothetical protein
MISHLTGVDGVIGRSRMVVGFTTTMQSVSITTKVVRSNPAQKEVTCDRYVVFTGYSGFNKTNRYDITEK